jgi:predicted house-cleaning noncanonical NTP pyrophosphatase (MazG superfamily)
MALYRDQIRENVLVKQYYCDIDIAHLISYNEELAHKLNAEPADIIPSVRDLLGPAKDCGANDMAV